MTVLQPAACLQNDSVYMMTVAVPVTPMQMISELSKPIGCKSISLRTRYYAPLKFLWYLKSCF